MTDNKRVVYHTLGCKLNFAETSAIGKMLESEGFVKCKKGEVGDVIVVNTCSVTDTADKKCRQAISSLRRKHPGAYVVVTGCYAQLKPEEVSQLEGVNLVLGANEKFDVVPFLAEMEKHQLAHGEIHRVRTSQIKSFIPIVSADDRTRHFLKVQDGCDYYCTYCTIPFARGRSRSASIADTLKVAKQAIEDGAKEIVLTGVNTGDFGKHNGENFLQLVQALDALEGEVRFRISSIEPNLITDEIIEFVAHSRHFSPHFHIPLQSGCNEVLELMKRRYKRELFAERIHHIKTIMPHAFIGVDVIVGTRGETPEYFEDSKQFIESLPISQLHVFTYSERAGTKALEIDYIVPHIERKRRSEILHQVSSNMVEKFYKEHSAFATSVLWEESYDKQQMHGFTENYVRVVAPYDVSKINTIEKVDIQSLTLEIK